MLQAGMLKIFTFIILGSSLQAGEIHLGLLGNIPETKTVEFLSAKISIDAANASPGHISRTLKLILAHDHGSAEGALEAAIKLAADPDLMGVVIHGEHGVALPVLKVFNDAGIAVVSASSYASPRSGTAGITWLSPHQEELAAIGAHYARKSRQVKQVAVIDNGAPTAAAAGRAFSSKFKELGGKVIYEGEWQGTEWGLTRTVKALAANWPQLIFFVGDGRDAGQLVKIMQKEKALKNSVLLGLPALFDPEFIDIARLDTKHSTVVFPCPDFQTSVKIAKYLGVSFPRDSPNYKSYVHFAYKKPGRWTAMVFDATQLLVEAVEKAATAPEPALTRSGVAAALNATAGYKGIRGRVKFSPNREPMDPKAMIFNAQPKVNTREMRWYDYNYGPPF